MNAFHDAAQSSPAGSTVMLSAKHQGVQALHQSPSKRPNQLPTPAASSQVGAADGEGLSLTKSLKSDRAPTSEFSADNPISITKLKSKYGVNAENPIRGGTTNTKTTTNNEHMPSDTSEDDYIPVFSVPKGRAQPTRLSSSSASESITPSSRRGPRSRRISTSPQTPRHSKHSSTKRPSARSFLLGGTSGAAPISNSQRRKSYTATKRSKPTGYRSETLDEEETSSDEQESFQLPPQRTLRSSRGSKQEARSARADQSRDSSGEGTKAPVAAKNMVFDPYITPNASNATMISDDNGGSDISDILPTPGRRRKTTRPKGNLPSNDGEASDKETDLEDELEDLRGTGELRSVAVPLCSSLSMAARY